jgi:hypothetical protein
MGSRDWQFGSAAAFFNRWASRARSRPIPASHGKGSVTAVDDSAQRAYDQPVSALPIGILSSLIAALIFTGVVNLIRRQRAKRTIAAEAAYPVRFTSRDVTDFHPQSGYHEVRTFEVFNKSDKAVTVKGFGLHIVFEGQEDWDEFFQATVHPAPVFPVRLEPNDALDGYIHMESLGDELHGRGLLDRIVSIKPYVEIAGYGEHNVEAESDSSEAEAS